MQFNQDLSGLDRKFPLKLCRNGELKGKKPQPVAETLENMQLKYKDTLPP